MRETTRQHLRQAAVVAVAIAAVLGLSHWLGIGLPLLGFALAVIFAVTRYAPHIGVRWLDEVILAVRSWLWRKESGRHHGFAGMSLDIEEHAGQMWISADSFQRAIRISEPQTVTAARMAGAHEGLAWRRNDDELLMLNVQAAVQHLSQMPGRMDPRVLRLRQYLERQVLFPAAQRSERSRPPLRGGSRPADAFADTQPGREVGRSGLDRGPDRGSGPV